SGHRHRLDFGVTEFGQETYSFVGGVDAAEMPRCFLQTVSALDDEKQTKGDTEEFTTALVNKPILDTPLPGPVKAATGTPFGLPVTDGRLEESVRSCRNPATGATASSMREETMAPNAAPMIPPKRGLISLPPS